MRPFLFFFLIFGAWPTATILESRHTLNKQTDSIYGAMEELSVLNIFRSEYISLWKSERM